MKFLDLKSRLYVDTIEDIYPGYELPLEVFENSYYYPFKYRDVNILSNYLVISNVETTFSQGLFLRYKVDGLKHITDKFYISSGDDVLPLSKQNEIILASYSMPVNEKIKMFNDLKKRFDLMLQKEYQGLKSWKLYDYNILILKPKPLIKRPLIQNELPVDDTELEIYLLWICETEGIEKIENLKDIYGTTLKFKILVDGIKVISAGPDQKFDTDDDFIFVSYR